MDLYSSHELCSCEDVEMPSKNVFYDSYLVNMIDAVKEMP